MVFSVSVKEAFMPATDPKTKENIALEVRDLGQMPYAEAFELQQQLQQQVIAGRRGLLG